MFFFQHILQVNLWLVVFFNFLDLTSFSLDGQKQKINMEIAESIKLLLQSIGKVFWHANLKLTYAFLVLHNHIDASIKYP